VRRRQRNGSRFATSWASRFNLKNNSSLAPSGLSSSPSTITASCLVQAAVVLSPDVAVTIVVVEDIVWVVSVDLSVLLMLKSLDMSVFDELYFFSLSTVDAVDVVTLGLVKFPKKVLTVVFIVGIK